MDVVEAGRERAPLRSGWLVAGGVLLAVLAVAGTLRATGLPHHYAARPVPTRAPYVPIAAPPSPLGNLVVDSSERPLPPGDGVRLTISGLSWLIGIDTRDDARTTLVDTGSDHTLRGFVPLRDGFAAIDGGFADTDGAFDPDSRATLVVRDGERETRRPVTADSRIVPGGDDTEFWLLEAGDLATRFGADGRPRGPRVAPGGGTMVLQGAPGGRLLVSDSASTLRLWDGGRLSAPLTEAGQLLSATGHYALWQPNCFSLCRSDLVDLVTGRVSSVPLPVGATFPNLAVVGPTGTVAYALTASGDETQSVYVVRRGAPRAVRIAADVPFETRLTWAGAHRLVLTESVDGRTVVLTWDGGRTLWQAGVYDAMEISDVAARRA
jgi:hypothetical protein